MGFWRSLLRLFRHDASIDAEPSRVIVGSTGSGKSEGELHDLLRLARRRDCAVVLLDGHGPLAFRAAGHWAARGHEDRLVYEPLRVTDRVLCWSMLPRSTSATATERRLDASETRDEVSQCFLAPRNLATLTDRPWTKEWLDAAIALALSQPESQPLSSLQNAFRVRSPEYEALLQHSDRPELVAKFRAAERLRPSQYEQLTGASRRMLELVCDSEVVRLRCRSGQFDWLEALRARRLVAFDGGGLRSVEVKRTLFLLATMQVIHAVRRHFAMFQRPLPVVLVLEEAGAFDLATPFVLSALQELRKAGLAIHLLTQSSLDFGDHTQFERILANVPWQAWYQCLAPSDQELGAKALTNAAFDTYAVHFHRRRFLRRPRFPTFRDHDADGERVAEPHFKQPSLQEQEFRTRLATLRVGERYVRDRHHVWRERLRPVRSPWLHPVADASTRAVIARVRQQPLYRPSPPRAAPFPAHSQRRTAAMLKQQWAHLRESGAAAAEQIQHGRTQNARSD